MVPTVSEVGERVSKIDRLREVRGTDARVGALMRERDRLRDLALGLTGRAFCDTVQPSGKVSSPMACAVARLCDLEAEICATVDALVDLRREAVRAICGLADARHAEVLHRRYLDGQTWDELAEGMGVSRQWALRLHDRAVDCLKFTPPV